MLCCYSAKKKKMDQFIFSFSPFSLFLLSSIIDHNIMLPTTTHNNQVDQDQLLDEDSSYDSDNEIISPPAHANVSRNVSETLGQELCDDYNLVSIFFFFHSFNSVIIIIVCIPDLSNSLLLLFLLFFSPYTLHRRMLPVSVSSSYTMMMIFCCCFNNNNLWLISPAHTFFADKLSPVSGVFLEARLLRAISAAGLETTSKSHK